MKILVKLYLKAFKEGLKMKKAAENEVKAVGAVFKIPFDQMDEDQLDIECKSRHQAAGLIYNPELTECSNCTLAKDCPIKHIFV